MRCTKCVMDETDSEIIFSNEGICNHCIDFENITKKNWYPNAEGEFRLNEILNKIKLNGYGKKYDCIIGLSGGIDSSFLALKAKDWGLRPLVIHVDAGWNSELAVSNIETIVKHCNYDLYTHIVDWSEMKNLQLAYLKSGISNQDVPQDHIFFSSLYQFATKNDIKYILSGGNIATESIFAKSWHGSAMDSINLKAINRNFGKVKLKKYKTISLLQYYFIYPFIYKMRTIRPLNYMDYNKEFAIEQLEKIGWKSYGRKHGESIFTKFFQNYYLPFRFNYDKRLPHLSSLIVSGQLTRDEALAKLEEPLYDSNELANDIKYFSKKLGITNDEFNELLASPRRSYTEFKNWDKYVRLLNIVKSIFKLKIKVYS